MAVYEQCMGLQHVAVHVYTVKFERSDVTSGARRLMLCYVSIVVCSSIIYNQLDVSRFCSTKDGTDGVLQMLLTQEVDVIFGPMCSSGRL